MSEYTEDDITAARTLCEPSPIAKALERALDEVERLIDLRDLLYGERDIDCDLAMDKIRMAAALGPHDTLDGVIAGVSDPEARDAAMAGYRIGVIDALRWAADHDDASPEFAKLTEESS